MTDAQPKSMHQYGLMLEKRNLRIRELEAEVARLKQGGQPASQLRDAVLPVLERIAAMLTMETYPNAERPLKQLISHLQSIPSLEPKPYTLAPPNYGKVYKPLDHGKPERQGCAA